MSREGYPANRGLCGAQLFRELFGNEHAAPSKSTESSRGFCFDDPDNAQSLLSRDDREPGREVRIFVGLRLAVGLWVSVGFGGQRLAFAVAQDDFLANEGIRLI